MQEIFSLFLSQLSRQKESECQCNRVCQNMPSPTPEPYDWIEKSLWHSLDLLLCAHVKISPLCFFRHRLCSQGMCCCYDPPSVTLAHFKFKFHPSSPWLSAVRVQEESSWRYHLCCGWGLSFLSKRTIWELCPRAHQARRRITGLCVSFQKRLVRVQLPGEINFSTWMAGRWFFKRSQGSQSII